LAQSSASHFAIRIIVTLLLNGRHCPLINQRSRPAPRNHRMNARPLTRTIAANERGGTGGGLLSHHRCSGSGLSVLPSRLADSV
jgi:hypothetical protein